MLVWEESHLLRANDFDTYGRIKPSAVLDLFQNAAGAHAKAIGVGFDAMLERLLETPPGKQGGTVRQFLRKYPHCPYAHVIVVGGQVPKGIRELYNGNRVSVLVLRRNAPPEGLQPDGTHVLSFTPDAYMTQLCRLEV